MDNILQLIKRAAIEAVIASKPCDTYIGKIKNLSPLEIAVGQKIVLDSEFLNVTEVAQRHMKKESKVLLIRQSGGQKYTVIDTIV